MTTGLGHLLEVYPVKLEAALGKEPEDWNMECCMCDPPEGLETRLRRNQNLVMIT